MAKARVTPYDVSGGFDMESTIAADIQGDSMISPLVRAGDDALKGVMGRAKHPPRAVWRLILRDNRSPLIELELWDQPDSVSRQFAPEELTDRFELHFKLSELWGDLIKLAFQGSIDRMVQALREIREEEALREAQLQRA